MNWKLKAHILAVLSRLPGGRRAYHFLQSKLGTNKLNADEYVSRALEIVKMIREAGGDPFGRVFLEIGTGWRPFLPFILYLGGSEKVITIDVNRWLNDRYTQETFRALRERLSVISDRLGLPLEYLRDRYAAGEQAKGLNGLLQTMGVEYWCPADACRTGLHEESVDFVCSSNVLEHIAPEVLRDIHRECLRILRPGGLAVHRFNPGDHSSHVDRSVTGVNFLRYSPAQWYWYGGSGLAYHNRLRCVQHQRLFEDAGFSIVTHRVRVDGPSLKAIQSGQQPIHQDFAHYRPEELAADYMWLVCQRPEERSSRIPPLGYAEKALSL